MKHTEIVHFYESEEIFDKAAYIFNRKKIEIQSFMGDVDIQHVGSSSVPGAVGKFDVDIQIRVNKNKFKESLKLLSKRYEEKHPEIWTSSFAAFKDVDECEIDIILTEIACTYDDFYKVRDFLINHPQKLEEYNNLKRSFEGKAYSEYRKAKVDFLGSNGGVKFL